MKPRSIPLLGVLLCAGALGPALSVSAAEATVTVLQTEARQTDRLVARHGTAPVQTRMVGEFTTFAGSEENAQSLVTGLRSSTPVTLTSRTATSPTTSTTTSLTFDPPTRPMGHGNVFISLVLAKQQLAGYGITDPTPQEIQAALTGGTITTSNGSVTLTGVLTQRASGMGWGVIAKSQGVKLGSVISGLKSANQHVATTTVTSSTSGSGTQTTTTTTTTTVSGKASNAYGRSVSSSHASGIVTAAGNSVGVRAGGTVNAGARAAGSGIVTGSGAAARGAGNAQGLAKGHFKD